MISFPLPAGAAPRVQFSRQVLPVLRKECGSCHQGPAAPGGYSIETAERLAAGGRHGAAVVPGKSGQSTLVKYLTGEVQPKMPPGKPLSLETIALVRRWIDEGGKIDSMSAPQEAGGIMRGAMPVPAPTRSPAAAPAHGGLLPVRVEQSAPVTALACSPDGKWLAAGGYRSVRLLDPATGAVRQTLTGPFDQVQSVAWSGDGKHLLAAGGLPGSFGEVCLWEVPTDGAAWSKPRTVREHADTIYGIAARRGTAEFATASLDKSVKLWAIDRAAGARVTKTLKEHADAVFGVAYSPDGKWLASASADRTVKLYHAGTGARAASLTHGDAVTAVAFGAKSDLVATACQDKQVRVWPVKEGTIENPLRGRGEGEAVNALAFSADGSWSAWGASNRRVRIWDGKLENQKREVSEPTDWVYSIAITPDGKTVAAGAGDGNVYFWSLPEKGEWKFERAVSLGPAVAAGAEAKR